MALDKFKATPLPNPPADYDPQYLRQVIRVLETYFSQLDSKTPNNAQKYTADEFVGGSFTGTDITATNVAAINLSAQGATIGYQRSNGVWTDALISYGHRAGRIISEDISAKNIYATAFYGDGSYLQKPYTQLVSNSNQTASAVDQAYALTYTGNDFPDGISVVSSSRITFAQGGIYILQFSLQLESTSTNTEHIDVWFRRNGSNIGDSNSRFGIPARKSAGVPATLVASTPYVVDVQANDYIQIIWAVSSTTVSIKQYPALTYSAGVNPTVPATPSVFVNIQYISAQFPPVTRAAPLPVFGFGEIGVISVVTR